MCRRYSIRNDTEDRTTSDQVLRESTGISGSKSSRPSHSLISVLIRSKHSVKVNSAISAQDADSGESLLEPDRPPSSPPLAVRTWIYPAFHGISGHILPRNSMKLSHFKPLNLFAASFIALLAAPSTFGETPNAASPVIAPGAKLEKLKGEYAFTEGPSADTAGNIYFTDQPNDRIVRWNAKDGSVEDWLKPTGRANGTVIDANGNLIACADEKNELWSISPDKKVTVLVKDFGGKSLNGPNDVWIRPDGGIYFTDPLYPRDYWKRSPKGQQDGEHVYYMAKSTATPERVISDLKQPNGIIGTPDGTTLYVADIGANKTYAYDIQGDGSLANKRLFCPLGSDGMTIDNEGNVYLTGRGVTIFDKTGKQIEHIAVNEPWTANVVFGGGKQDLLFITASKGIYGIKMRVKGAGSQ